MTTFSFTARPSTDQQQAIARHVGARRFAWNQSLRLVVGARQQKRTDPSVEVPRTAYSLINAINGWKRSEGAGRCFVVGSNGQTTAHLGLPWRHQVCAQVFEEAAVDLARALDAADKAKGTKRRVGFPKFQKKGRCAQSFRLRNKVSKTGTPSMTVGGTEPRSITLPVLGTMAVREDTRALRGLLRSGTDGPRAGSARSPWRSGGAKWSSSSPSTGPTGTRCDPNRAPTKSPSTASSASTSGSPTRW